jgi:hypothetical protein
VSYVDAGYVSALGVLFVYGIALVLRRRRWERAVEVADDEGGPTAAPADSRD